MSLWNRLSANIDSLLLAFGDLCLSNESLHSKPIHWLNAKGTTTWNNALINTTICFIFLSFGNESRAYGNRVSGYYHLPMIELTE